MARRILPMLIAQTRLSIDTAPREIKEITGEVARWAERQRVSAGLLILYIPHTSASLLVQENASPDVLRDLDAFFRRIVPEDVVLYRHNDEGPDDMPAHIKSALTQTQLTIPMTNGRLQLGTWQGIFLLEHRASPHSRSLILTLIGQEDDHSR
jgi:secondary thiamine-phosphate synthase enzyme